MLVVRTLEGLRPSHAHFHASQLSLTWLHPLLSSQSFYPLHFDQRTLFISLSL